MRAAGLVVADALEAVHQAITPGVTTGELDRIADGVIRAAGGQPSFLGYGEPPFPATICASVNDEIVHGIPGSKELHAGDLVSIDCGAIINGWHGDAAFSAIVSGDTSSDTGVEADFCVKDELNEVTRQSLWHGISALARGNNINDVGCAIEDFVDGRFRIIRDYAGHGIGTQMHMEPEVLNYRARGRGLKLRPGLVVAIEPMLVEGTIDTITESDDWTVVTADGKNGAHWEHTVAITDEGVWVLTAHDGGKEELSVLGVPIAPLDS